MSDRSMLHAYLRSQEAHKELHQVTKGFEQDSSDEELLKRISAVQRLLNEAARLITGK
jgi:hypothetical protein